MAAVGIPGVWELVIVALLGGGIGVPLGVPPGPEDPLLAKVAPEECLFYASWAGMATPEPDSPNQVEQMLAEPEIQQLLKDVEQQIVTGLQKVAEEEGDEAELVFRLAPDLVKTLLTRPTAVFVSRAEIGEGPPDVSATLIVNLGDKKGVVEDSLNKLESFVPESARKSVEIGGAPAHQVQFGPEVPALTWMIRSNYLIAGVGDDAVTSVFKRASTPPPEWMVSLRKNLAVERLSTVSYLNVESLVNKLAPLGGPEVATVLDASGLDGVKSLSSVTGLEGTGFVGRSLLEVQGQPEGLLEVVAGQPLAAEDLAPIPADSTLALAFRFDAAKAFDLFLDAVEQVEPGARGEIMEGVDEIKDELGVDVREDILASLGDVWCAYNSPGEGGLILTGLTATVAVKDPAKLQRAHDRFVGLMRAEMGGRGDERRHRGPRLKEIKVAGEEVFVITGIDDEFPFAPSWCLTDTHFLFAAFPQNIKAMLTRGDEYKSLATAAEVAPLLAEDTGPTLLFYQDTPELFRLGYPLLQMLAAVASQELQEEGLDVDVSLLPSARSILPHLRPGVTMMQRTNAGIVFETRQTLPGGNVGATIPLLGAIGVPAIAAARRSAQRVQSVNNLRQLAIAMHNHHAAMGRFPAAYIADTEGKPLLSWRVRILPYVEGNRLYDEFKLDEPWDSEHNKKLIERMPDVFKSSGGEAGSGKTRYMTIRGKDTVFPGGEGVRIAQITDGSSNTMMIVEAGGKSVIWTKPDDFEYDPENPMDGLIGIRRDGFNAAFCDGSCRFLSAGLAKEMLLRLFTRNDGETVEVP